MRRYLSTLVCSGLLSIGALYGAPAFAESIPNSIPDISPTVAAAREAIRTLPAQLTTDDQIWNPSCTTGACQGRFEPAVLMRKPTDGVTGGLQFVRGGFHGGGGFHGFGGGFHGFGGGFHGFGSGFHGFGGFHGFHGMGRFHGGPFFHHRRFYGGYGLYDGDWGWFGLGLPWILPYYYGYYGGYHRIYHAGWHHRHSVRCYHHYHSHWVGRRCIVHRY